MDFHLVCQRPALARRLARRGGGELTQKKTEEKKEGKFFFFRLFEVFSNYILKEEGEFLIRFP